MTKVEKISLYDFAKMVLGGREPSSVTFLDPTKSSELSKISYFGTDDKFESLRFSQDDFFSNATKSNDISDHFQFDKSKFPGIV
jgi:hypothetical protein